MEKKDQTAWKESGDGKEADGRELKMQGGGCLRQNSPTAQFHRQPAHGPLVITYYFKNPGKSLLLIMMNNKKHNKQCLS